MSIVAGVDFGTLSVRVSIVDSDRGTLGFGVSSYAVQRRADDPHHASQRHEDHMNALVEAMQRAIASAHVEGRDLAALAVASTASTVVPVGAALEPLDDYYLWCDHRAWREADEFTKAANKSGLEAIRFSGGTQLSEFGFPKLLHWLRQNPHQRSRFVTAIEHCDMAVATLCGISDPLEVPRSVCAMGHKWMWNASLDGLPSEAFLRSVDELLAGVRDRMGRRFETCDRTAGTLCAAWASRLGLRSGIPLPIGGVDAHWDAVGAGIRLGDIVNVIGTSTCVMAISQSDEPIPGVSGVVRGSIHPAYTGIEAGLSATGDLFEAIARRAHTTTAELFNAIADYRSGQTALLRLAWDNGDRTVLGNPHLRGVTIGWNLAHTAADELFAAIEGTAFHTRIIFERLAEHGVPIRRVINAGGIPRKSRVLNQVYANILNTPILVPESDATSLGSAIFAFLAARTFATIEEAQDALCPKFETIEPDARYSAACEDLFRIYRRLYFCFGDERSDPTPLGDILPSLQRIAHSSATA